MPVFSGNNDSSPGKQPAQQGNDPYDFPSTGRLLPIRGIATEAGFQLSGPAMSVKVDNAHQLVRIAATKQPELHNHRLDRMDISQLNIGLRAVITRTLKTGVGAADLGVISKGRPDGKQMNRLGDAGGQFPTENTTHQKYPRWLGTSREDLTRPASQPSSERCWGGENVVPIPCCSAYCAERAWARSCSCHVERPRIETYGYGNEQASSSPTHPSPPPPPLDNAEPRRQQQPCKVPTEQSQAS